jgi:hypothetical protein
MTDREYVESVWACEIEILDAGPRFCSASVACGTLTLSFVRSTLDEAWSAAAEFTRDRIEEIKKARRDTQSVEDWDADRKGWIALLGMGHEEPEYIASISRILTLVRAHLDTLCVGIKPEALK